MSAQKEKKSGGGGAAAGGKAKPAAAAAPAKAGKGDKKSSKKASSASSAKKSDTKAQTKPELSAKLKAKGKAKQQPHSQQGQSAFQFQDPSAARKAAVNGSGAGGKKHKADGAKSSSSAPPASSIFNAPAEIDFPRGGGSALTPVEYRQTLREARAEAAAAGDGGDVHFTDGAASGAAKRKGKAPAKGTADAERATKKRKAGASAGETAAAALQKDSIRVEHLNYKRLAPGSRVLATILAVHPLALVLSLPNQLLAHVPITHISSIFTRRLETAADAEDEDMDEDDDSDDESSDEDSDAEAGDASGAAPAPRRKYRAGAVPELRDMYRVGQFVIATVQSVASASALRGERFGPGREGGEYERESRRVVCSLDPADVNAGIDAGAADAKGGAPKGDLAPGYLLPVAIKAKEDNGWAVDLGLGEGVAGFLPFSETPLEAGSSKARVDYAVGESVVASITSLAARSGKVLVQLSTEPSKLTSAALGPAHAPSLGALMPGLRVRALVTAASAQGLAVKLWGMFDATIDLSHLPPLPAKAKDLASAYKVGSHVAARILWDQGPAKLRGRGAGAGLSLGDEGDSDNDDDGGFGAARGMDDNEQDRKIGLSAVPHVLELEQQAGLATRLPIGTDVTATITACDADWGLSVSVTPEGASEKKALPGFVHISRVSDDHIVRLSAASGTYKLGSTHKARVVGHALTDRLVLLSMQPSVLARSFMRVSQVQVGEVLRATVKEVKPTGIFLDLGGSVDGIVFPLHFSDIVLKKPEKKFKAGMKANAKVLLVEPARNRIALTLKKTLVNSELPVIASIQDARVGMLTHATISKVLDADKGLLVDFFAGTRALVPSSEASESFLTDLRTQFYEGKPVKVRVTHVDYGTGRLVASIRQASASFQARLNVDAVELGQAVEATLAAVHQDVIVLSLVPSQVRALLSLSILAKHRGVSVEQLRSDLQEGEVLKDLVVVSKNQEKGIVIVGTAGSPSARVLASSSGAAPKQGQVYQAKVIKESEPTAVTVMLPGKCRGRLHLLDCHDDPAHAELPALESTVKVIVLNLRNSASKADVSMRASLIAAAEANKTPSADAVPNKAADLQVGQKYNGYVKSIANAGLFVDVGRYVTARVKIGELFDGFVKDWQPKFKVGQLVHGTVTEIDAKQNKVEMSLKTGVKPAKTASEAKPEAVRKPRIADYEKGQKVNGFIRGINQYGVFVQIDGTNISGLCHKSQLADSAPDDALRAFSIGDRVKAMVIEVSADKGKISFGLKPSYFSAADFVADGQPATSAAAADDDESDSEVDDDDGDSSASDGEDDDMLSGDELDEPSEADTPDSGAEDDSGEDDFIDADESAGPSKLKAKKAATQDAPKLELAGGFSWSGQADDGAHEGIGSFSDVSHDSDDDEAPRKKASADKGKGKKGKGSEDITADLATKAPESSTDFERVLLGSPNSSYIWIQFMSFHLQLGDVDRAREVARRALKIINFREEQERLNVWIALLNLENTYGSDETVDKTFKEAAQVNDAKTIHLRMVQIYERTHKFDKAQEMWKRTTKKFGMSSKVWVQYNQFLLRQGKAEEARQLLPRSMQSLPKRKHVKTITAFALNEFRLGDSERGRTIFEGLLDTYPKRLDLWLQYIDQEAKECTRASTSTRAAALPRVRALFDRVLSLRQSTKKGKAVLKKWLEFEKRAGTPDGQQAVLARARAFVEESQKKHAGNAAPEADEYGEEAEAASDDDAEEDDEAEDDEEDMA